MKKYTKGHKNPVCDTEKSLFSNFFLVMVVSILCNTVLWNETNFDLTYTVKTTAEFIDKDKCDPTSIIYLKYAFMTCDVIYVRWILAFFED